MKPRKIPMRKDIVTGEMFPKNDLIRVVKNNEDEISIDPTGKANGRGAYIGLDVKIAKEAFKKHTLDKAFGIAVSDEFYEELIAYVDHQQARKELFGDAK
ncbi:YlxR family protein [Periweissella cryptocerci]|uniref:YlxR family protein n=1 Tax=Periweissella cryptocerci TaxID=2506420 RepID=A0A4P6YWD4_9LACO|nr:YlxR family protein [Periweissella cryptocerci]QBO37138.1 YlxR family protein [Periweissella cryptocerci]